MMRGNLTRNVKGGNKKHVDTCGMSREDTKEHVDTCGMAMENTEKCTDTHGSSRQNRGGACGHTQNGKGGY
jgi:hypothetical protein